MTSKKRTTLSALAGILLIGTALYLALGDRIPLAALAGSAEYSVTPQAMIGKATHAQQKKLEPMLTRLEAEETPDEKLLDQARQQKAAIDKDLQLALNLIHAGNGGPDASGWYYAACNIQQKMAQRLDALTAKLDPDPAPTPAEEPGEPGDGAPPAESGE